MKISLEVGSIGELILKDWFIGSESTSIIQYQI